MTADACKRKLAIFDGRQRADIDLVFKRIQNVKADKGYQGPVVVCQVLYNPVAGHRPERAAIKYLIAQRDMEIWFAPIAGTRLLAPYRFSVPTTFGLGTLQATYFVTNMQSAAIPGPRPRRRLWCRPPRRRSRLYSPSFCTAYFCSSGNWNAAKINVSGTTPNTLKFTQKSVVCVRQIDLVRRPRARGRTSPSAR